MIKWNADAACAENCNAEKGLWSTSLKCVTLTSFESSLSFFIYLSSLIKQEMGFYRPLHLLSVSETFSAGYRVPRRAIRTESSRRTPLYCRSNIISLKKSRLSLGNGEKQDGERQRGRKDDIIMKPSKYLFYCVVESVPFYCTVSLWVQRQMLWLPACPVTRRPHRSPISTLTSLYRR